MKKFILILAAFFLVSSSFAMSLPTNDNSEKPPVKYNIGYGVSLTAKEIMALTPKEYKKLTGHNMGFVKAWAFKKAQKNAQKSMKAGGDKSQVVALILVLLVGTIGIHRFYLGYTWQGIVQILTLGGLGIWTLIDLIRIITGSLQPKDGSYNPTL